MKGWTVVQWLSSKVDIDFRKSDPWVSRLPVIFLSSIFLYQAFANDTFYCTPSSAFLRDGPSDLSCTMSIPVDSIRAFSSPSLMRACPSNAWHEEEQPRRAPLLRGKKKMITLKTQEHSFSYRRPCRRAALSQPIPPFG